MRKRAVSLILCLCMVLSFVPVPVLAQNVENDNPFTDVKESDWFYDGVQYVFEHELMKGTSSTIFETLFEPERATQRGMIVTILYRLDESPPVTDICPFEDVPRGSNYEDAIIWAANNGIVKGYTDTSFGPYDDITRQQMAAILYRYANVKRYDVTEQANLNVFTDSGRISNYARVPLSWANAKELINGITPTILAPTEKVTRAQSAVILTRFCENIVEGSVTPSPTVTYTVTFDLNYRGAGTNQTVSVEQGKTVSEPDAPKRTGYNFGGWYTTAVQQKTRFNFNTAINSNITLYARWTSRPSNSSGSSSNSGNNNAYPPQVTTYTVSFNSNGGSEVKSQSIRAGGTITKPDNPTKANCMLVGWYLDQACTEYVEFSNVRVNSDMVLYARWLDFDESSDSDNDNIPDDLESLLGLDPTADDTDGDGLADYVEINTLYLSPLLTDTDGNGISDSEEDNDSDGLTNLQEVTINTNPTNADSDNDGLNDYEEARTYGTNPLSADTDGVVS